MAETLIHCGLQGAPPLVEVTPSTPVTQWRIHRLSIRAEAASLYSFPPPI
jgi:hypothetical protein